MIPVKKYEWEHKGSILVHSQHGLGIVESVLENEIVVAFSHAEDSRFVRDSTPWFISADDGGASLTSDSRSTLHVRVAREIVQNSVSGKDHSCWSFLPASESAERTRSDVSDLCQMILTHDEVPVAFGSNGKKAKKGESELLISSSTLFRQLDRARHLGSVTPLDYMQTAIQLSDAYARRLVELRKVSDGNGGFRISASDLVRARDDKRELVREIRQGTAWQGRVFPSLPLGMSRRFNMSMIDLCRQLSRGSMKNLKTTTKKLLASFEERTEIIFLPVAEQAEAEANAEIVRRSNKNTRLTAQNEPDSERMTQ